MDSTTQPEALQKALQKAQDQTAAPLDCTHHSRVEEDPGIIVKFAPKANIHRLLSLPAIANIPDLVQGINEDDSFRIFVGWLNSIVTKHAGPAAVVRTLDDWPVAGLYHNLIKAQHSHIEADQSWLVWLTVDIVANSVGTHSAGQYFAIECSGTGSCTIVHKKLGPFCLKVIQ